MGRKKEHKQFLVSNHGCEYSNGDCHLDNSSKEQNENRKLHLSKVITKEFDYISNLFDLLDIEHLCKARKREDEDYDEDLLLPDIPEKKIFKKTPSKKASAPKKKKFPNSIENLEKELEELKGTPMTYQKQIRKKGLQARLTKKRRKAELKQQKAALKQGKRFNGPGKLIKPVLNSDGNVVSNKFDFADNEVKKEIKRKHSNSLSEYKDENETNKKNKSLSKNLQSIDAVISPIKKENDDLERNEQNLSDIKSKSHQGPIFNKDNKMVFSKVLLGSDDYNKPKKKKLGKDAKKILEKIKEDSQKLSELEKEDKEKAMVIKERQKWSTALKRASGEKVKDDPELLKKSISREKNQKLRSQKKWKARIERVEKEKEERQKKRKDNIQKKKLEIKKLKKKKAIKKGRFIQV